MKGFTLIELLIVMLIISIVAGIAVLSISTNQHKQYEMLANQLVNKIQLAEQEAMLREITIGLGLTSHTVQFYVYQHNTKTGKHSWQAMAEPAFKLHQLPDNLHITLKVNDEVAPADGHPRIVISPNMALTPFVILIGKKHENPHYQIIGKANGEVTSEIFYAEK